MRDTLYTCPVRLPCTLALYTCATMELSTVIFIGLLVCVVKDVHAVAKRKPLARQLSRMEHDMKACKGTIEAKIDSMNVNIQNTKTRLKAITLQLTRVERQRNTYRDDLGKVLKELTVTRRDIRALEQDVQQLNTSCVMRTETVPGSTAAPTDPSLSTTVQPVTITTQDPDQHATPSAAAGRVLYNASRDGDLETVRRIVAAGHVDLNYRGEWSSRTPVMEAAWEGHRDVFEFLVGEGADLSLVDVDGDNILYLACYGGDLETVKLIVSRNVVDINSRGQWSMTPVIMAAWKGHRDVVEFLVGEGAHLSLVDKDGNNILHLACREGDLEMAKLIVSRNVVDINSRGWYSRTPVMAAAVSGHRDVVEFLVGEGAQPSLLDKWGNNILHLACRWGHLETVKLIVSLDVVDINSRGRWGITPVMWAELMGHRDVVKFLVGEGADPSLVDINSRGWNSMTPVMRAAWSGHRDVVEFLVGEGADPSLVDKDGENILHLACMGGHLETVKLIVSRNMVDINSRGRYSKTPVMAAAWEGHRDVVEFLVDEGADTSLVDEDGENVLHWACREGDLETVKLILALDLVDVNARNNNGKTAADVARDWGYQRVFEFLVREAFLQQIEEILSSA